ncbi:NADH:flavin oxidoreductase/NADH oxidase [Rhodococcus sp. NPDC060086]|uniref:NADH:flavin oxidoreductase/NADH oxidase n=1 Tax=Rhodococcus sp. NPDC060086 TaxID=3347055 RepID=UPI0036674784
MTVRTESTLDTATSAQILFEPLALREVTFGNRIWLSPMCQYSAVDGVPGDWHLTHLGARAAGGFGAVVAEATAVTPGGRISPQDTGLWNDEQTRAWSRIVDFVHERGTHAGIQLTHAGRKASIHRPWDTEQGSIPPSEGGWPGVGPDSSAFPGLTGPHELTSGEIGDIVDAFGDSACRADRAGFDLLELQAAHGFLIHSFLSPLGNTRTDSYGGSFEGRTRLLVEIVDAVRAHWPQHKPLSVRFSATDWLDGGLTPDDIVATAELIAPRGVDLIDVSSGGLLPAAIPLEPGYQVPLAREVRRGTDLAVGAVGLIDDTRHAAQILQDGSADVIFLGRAALRDPNWPLRAAKDLGLETRARLWQPQSVRGDWS